MFSLFWFILLPILTSVSLYLIHPKRFREIIIIFQLGFFAYTSFFYRGLIEAGSIVEKTGRWDAPIGILLKATPINFTLVLLTTLIFLVAYIFCYRESYFNKKFMFLTLILQGLLLGVFLSNDLFNIYVLIEVSTIIITILIMFNSKNRIIYDGMVFFLLNMVAMSFFLVGLGFIYRIFGSIDVDVIKGLVNEVDKKVLIMPYAFLMTALSFKCALAPLMAWVTRAYSTPSAPSIMPLILSGVSAKASFIIFFKVSYIFQGVIDASLIFMVLGAITAIAGFFIALSQKDLRRILAYHSVSQMGLIIFAFHLGGKYSYYGALYHSINHSLFKGLLFIALAIVIKRYGSAKVSNVKGVIKEYPYVALALAIGILSIMGAPLFNGSISKFYIAKDANNFILFILMQVINIGTIMSFVKFASILFGESTLEVYGKKMAIPLNKYIAIYILAALCLLGGLFGTQFMNYAYGIEFTFDILAYIEKSIVFVFMLLFSIYFYRNLYEKFGVFNRVREREYEFRFLVSLILVFFIVFTVTIKYTVL